MSILKKILDAFSSEPRKDPNAYWVYVRCDQCDEILKGRVDMRNDLSASFGQSDRADSYYTRKVFVGSQRCFRPLEVELWFDGRRRLTEQKIQGGKFATEEDYLDFIAKDQTL